MGSGPIEKLKKPVDLAAASRAYVAALGALKTRDFPAAERHLRRSLEINPDDFAAQMKLASLLMERGRHDEAFPHAQRATELSPNVAIGWWTLGLLKFTLHLIKEALDDFDRAVAVQPNLAMPHYGRGISLSTLERYEEAAAAYDKAAEFVETMPQLSFMKGEALYIRMIACDWKGLAEAEKEVIAGLKQGIRMIQPLPLLSIADDPALQLNAATMHMQARTHAPDKPLWKGEVYTHDRIRVAYCSPDFHNHPLSFLTAGVYEHHDRKRFHAIAVATGAGNADSMRNRLMAGVETFVDASNTADEKVAQWIWDNGIDIVVDLAGHTSVGSRPQIFAQRPAPVQVFYLGYPGSSGAPSMDYILGDPFVIPEGSETYYSEKIARLPECFQPHDDKRPRPGPVPARSTLGLPDDVFVFSSFNNPSKLNPELFDTWMRLLRAVPNSVLWIYVKAAATREHLTRAAEERGVRSERLIFAKGVSYPEHITRSAAADLFLDAYPFNGGTTASDALWSGVPVVTRAGAAFAARMAGSLLHAIGLPELVTYSWDEYEAVALGLATHPAELAQLRARLAANRDTAPLFDTVRFTRHLEAAYETMVGRARQGLPPESFTVPPLPRG